MQLLNSEQMAHFAARGFLRLDAVVPTHLNQKFLQPLHDQAPNVAAADRGAMLQHFGQLMASKALPFVDPGTPWPDAYPTSSTLGEILRLPAIEGAIQSLVGSGAVVDHHFLHLTFPPAFHGGHAPKAQHTHQDSTIDPRQAFDMQLMYFPHEVTAAMGGTRFLPGSHLRIVSEAAIGRYQNILGQEHMVCPAGTVLLLHHGIWHGGGSNTSTELRYMLKIRFCPTQRQVRLWDCRDLDKQHFQQRPIFWSDPERPADPVQQILTTAEPWFEFDTSRLEYINRVRFWRYLLGDDSFDADYWLTRIENEPQ